MRLLLESGEQTIAIFPLALFQILILTRNLPISYSFDPWIAAAGFQNAHITLGCLFVGIALFGIPLFFVNKKLRALFSRLG
jgi:hypothetical protein